MIVARGAAADKYCKPVLAAGQPAIGALDPKAKLNERQARMLKFAPIVYLHPREKYLPMRVEDYFTHRSTRFLRGKIEVIPAGKVTMAAIYETYKKGGKQSELHFRMDDCGRYGSAPAANRIRGVLSTPVYALYLTQGDADYIQYILFYGYNGSYPLKVLGVTLKSDVGGQHWGDIEHITVKLNRDRSAIEEIFFAAHGGADGMRLGRDLITFEGNRPVVYSALNGHGSYPRDGLFVRVGSFASDETAKGTRWDPRVVEVFAESSSGANAFDPRTMGWLYIPGKLGPDGIDGLWQKDWFMNPAAEKPAFKPLENWCKSPNDRVCMIRKMGRRAVWQPILDEIEGTLGKKVLAPIRAALSKARDAVKGAVGKATAVLQSAAHKAGRAIQGAARSVKRAAAKAAQRLKKGLKKLKFW
jgi:hypothetical protein